jgi:hypothetical protein
MPEICGKYRIFDSYRFHGMREDSANFTYSAATPLESDHFMAKGFEGSVVLEQDSAGHCSLSSPSLCTAKAIRTYFQTGKPPAPGTVCAVDQKPFLGWVGKNHSELSEEDNRLKQTLQEAVAKW